MAERARAAVLVPNLFLRIPIDAALRAAGAVPVGVTDAGSAAAGEFKLVILDLEAVADAAEAVRRLVAAGKTVLASGPHVEGPLLAACRAAGAVVLPRSSFLARLPGLLDDILPRAGKEEAP